MFQIKTTVKDVESPLTKSELEAIDVKLSSAETTLFWNSEGTKATFVSPWFSLAGWGLSQLSSVCPVTRASGCFCPSSHSGLRGPQLRGGLPRRGGRWAQGGCQRSRKKCAREAEDRLPDLPHPRTHFWLGTTSKALQAPCAIFSALFGHVCLHCLSAKVGRSTSPKPGSAWLSVGKDTYAFSCHCCPKTHFFPAAAAHDAKTCQASPAPCWWLEGQGRAGCGVPWWN